MSHSPQTFEATPAPPFSHHKGIGYHSFGAPHAHGIGSIQLGARGQQELHGFGLIASPVGRNARSEAVVSVRPVARADRRWMGGCWTCDVQVESEGLTDKLIATLPGRIVHGQKDDHEIRITKEVVNSTSMMGPGSGEPQTDLYQTRIGYQVTILQYFNYSAQDASRALGLWTHRRRTAPHMAQLWRQDNDRAPRLLQPHVQKHTKATKHNIIQTQ